MSTYITAGFSHHDVPLPQLEGLAVGASALDAVQEAALATGCAEVLVLSTCSRTELHAVLDSAADGDDELSLAREVAGRLVHVLLGPAAGEGLAHRATTAVGDDAVRHLFRVTSGLDSRIVGETEVQAQLRAAARAAAARVGEPHRLRRLVASALAAARQAAEDERGPAGRGLLARRAVARTLAMVDDEATLEAVVVGAGTIGRQVLDALPSRRCRATLLSRRSSARAGTGPQVHPLEELPARLAAADVVYVATSAGRRILTADLVRAAVRTRPERALTIVDLSLPRNVDPGVIAVPGVRLFNLDDLADGSGARLPEPSGLAAAEETARLAADRFCAGIRSRQAGPMITALRARVEEVCLDALQRTTRGTAVPDDVLARMASAVAGALAHSPTVLVRDAAADGDTETLDVLAAAFRLPRVKTGITVQ